MKDIVLLAESYFGTNHETFWRWAEDGSVVEWRHGPTIAFREEVRLVLGALAPGGLPPFGAILLLLAACRREWRERSDASGILCGMLRSEEERGILEDALRCLDVICGSLPEATETPGGKALLATLAFEKTRERLEPDRAARIFSAFASGELDELLSQLGGRETYPLLRDLKLLRSGVGSVSLAEFQDRVRTGLDRVPDEAPVELPEPTADLLDELAGDRETEGLARLVKRLIAAIRLPHRTGSPADEPGGGYSDIGNRGDLDRLLVSELAQDDLTLAVRVANQEALYLHRESPPAHPRQARALFLDGTIRMWGIPRVMAMAAALAISRNADGVPVVEVRQHSLEGFVPVDLNSRDAVMAALGVLNPTTSCAASLLSLAGSAALAPAVDRILITHPKTLEDHAFLAVERELGLPFALIACVDRAGGFCLHECTPAGRKVVSTAQFDVREILGPVVHRRESPADGLPLFLRELPCPLLLPTAVPPQFAAYDSAKGALVVDTRKRLILYPHLDRGGRQVSPAFPTTAALAFASFPQNTEGDFAGVWFDEGQVHYAIHRDGSPELCREGAFHIGNALHGEIHGEQLVLYRKDSVAAYSLATGELIRGQTIPTLGPAKGGVSALICDGKRVTYDGSRFSLVHSAVSDEAGVARAAHGIRCRPRLFTKLNAVLLHPEHGLAIETHKQKHKLFDLEKLCLKHEGKVLHSLGFQRHGFREKQERTAAGQMLRSVRIGDRGTIFFDDRGLLHLVSEELGLPEVTVALVVDRPFAAWASDGSIVGPGYFHEPGVQLTPAPTFAKLLQRVIQSFLPS